MVSSHSRPLPSRPWRRPSPCQIYQFYGIAASRRRHFAGCSLRQRFCCFHCFASSSSTSYIPPVSTAFLQFGLLSVSCHPNPPSGSRLSFSSPVFSPYPRFYLFPPTTYGPFKSAAVVTHGSLQSHPFFPEVTRHMSRYDDYRRSTGHLEPDSDRWDADRFSRERRERLHSRGPPVLDRPRRVEDDRFEHRLQENDRYGPPARRPDRFYEDEHIIPTSGPLVAYDRRRDSPPPRPRLLRRQSSLDTFDRVPSRKLDEYYYRDPPARAPVRPVREPDYYEEIRVADPDVYGDEEFHQRDRFRDRPRRSSSRHPARVVEEVEIERPYPRKGKTRMPRKLVHPAAVREFGYPYEDEVRHIAPDPPSALETDRSLQQGDMAIILAALSKDQIDEVISRSRQMKHRTDGE